MKAGSVNVLAIVKGGERYILLYGDRQRCEALDRLGRWAANPDLSFDWHDATAMRNRMRQLQREAESSPQSPKNHGEEKT